MLTDSYYIVLGKDTKEEVVRYLLSRKVPNAWTTDIYKACRFHNEEQAVSAAQDIADGGKIAQVQKVSVKFKFNKPVRIHQDKELREMTHGKRKT